ncbi:hypothetical protein MP228_005405 [Amoeboaphelidium protococcarum]|nr:hypothetical protein MP228_005405 [Amoeboaphelidium protococcarum]
MPEAGVDINLSKVRAQNAKLPLDLPAGSADTARRLNVSGNHLSSAKDHDILHKIGFCHRLSWLNISDNKISSLEFLRALKQLSVLNVSHNKITQLPIYLQNLPQLKALIMNDNQICKIESSVFSTCPELNTIVLSNNSLNDESLAVSIDDQTRGVFSAVKHLKKLSLSNNKLSSFPLSLDANLELKELRLSHNKIKVLEPLGYTNASLDILDLGSNDITTREELELISQAFPLLRQLNLKGNPVMEILQTNDGGQTIKQVITSIFSKVRVFNGERLDERIGKRKHAQILSEAANQADKREESSKKQFQKSQSQFKRGDIKSERKRRADGPRAQRCEKSDRRGDTQPPNRKHKPNRDDTSSKKDSFFL